MRISNFAKKHSVTVDCVRYYIKLGLLHPVKCGKQSVFTKSSSADLMEILFLKKLGFTLTEIQKILNFIRFRCPNKLDKAFYYKNLFLSKQQDLLKKKKNINKTLEFIKTELISVSKKISTPNTIDQNGIPLTFLSYLSCPYCNNTFSLKKATISNNMIIEGELTCSCSSSSSYIIKNEVIIHNFSKPSSDIPVNYNNMDYILKTPLEFINALYKGVNLIKHLVAENGLSNKVVLELGSGLNLFSNQIHTDSSDFLTYIYLNDSIEKINTIKDTFKYSNPNHSYIFLCCDFNSIPLKAESVDIIIDHYKSSFYCLHNSVFLINKLDYLVKKDGSWIGSFFYFDNNNLTLINHSQESKKYLTKDSLTDFLINSKFKLKTLDLLGYIKDFGMHEELFNKNDNIYQLVYNGNNLIKTNDI